MMLRPQLAFDADGDGAKHGEAVAGAIIACVRKQLLETMAECGMDGAQADAALDVLLERTQIFAALVCVCGARRTQGIASPEQSSTCSSSR